MKQLATFSTSLSLILMVASSASAQSIDFETINEQLSDGSLNLDDIKSDNQLSSSDLEKFINFEGIDGILPDGSEALDDMKITDQFSSLGITFGIDANLDGINDPGKSPVLEAVGYSKKDPKSGFANGHLSKLDVAAPSFESRLGSFFLRTDTPKKTIKEQNLLITYNSPTSGASGEIWDIDGGIRGTEQWRIEALGQDLSVIDSILSPLGTTLTLDAKPWLWSFDRDVADINAIRFNFVGTKKNVAGLAFDNFSVYSVENSEKVPEPTSVLSLLTFGIFGTMLLKRKQRKTPKELGIN
ncbi:PEP-CTERM sorting domain-containing protein [Oscillatoria salina]|nr:PEP-CTERM sorting domain-containing protein [Oscillatoria salina IIICB1]NET86922.1 PEP-CTERM sorting domain-containing protein [Kamptonema sp. SIO1D9]